MPTLSTALSRMRTVRSVFSSPKRQSSTAMPPQAPPSPSPSPPWPNDRAVHDVHKSNRQRPGSHPPKSFAETLRVISREAQNTQFDDVFDAFFFPDKRCQNRAFFMAARLQHTLRLSDAVIRLVTHRLYTLNYILFVLPQTCQVRARFLAGLEQQLALVGDGQTVHRRGGMEADFAVRYALRHARTRYPTEALRNDDTKDEDAIVERSRVTLAHCLESESKLGRAERDAMYVFHAMRAGLHGTFEPQIRVNDDPLAATLHRAVRENKEKQKPAYVNPFEDDSAIVREDDEDERTRCGDRKWVMDRARHVVDSGFYDDITLHPPTPCT